MVTREERATNQKENGVSMTSEAGSSGVRMNLVSKMSLLLQKHLYRLKSQSRLKQGGSSKTVHVPRVNAPQTLCHRRRRSTGWTPTRHRRRFFREVVSTRWEVVTAVMRFDRRCDCGTGICGRGVGECEAGGEGAGRGDGLEGLQGESNGKDAVG